MQAVMLTTFREVSWNEPFYSSGGFKTLDNQDFWIRIRAILDAEVAAGLPAERRCAMRLDLVRHSQAFSGTETKRSRRVPFLSVRADPDWVRATFEHWNITFALAKAHETVIAVELGLQPRLRRHDRLWQP